MGSFAHGQGAVFRGAQTVARPCRGDLRYADLSLGEPARGNSYTCLYRRALRAWPNPAANSSNYLRKNLDPGLLYLTERLGELKGDKNGG